MKNLQQALVMRNQHCVQSDGVAALKSASATKIG